ncbi:MAG TPA: hypothetical protein VHV83_18680 [Armatimonadota bacterium]|nr:hypothetical protein [Armatimonadota bacterium]
MQTTILTMLNHIRQNVEMIIYFEKVILQRRELIASSYCRKPSFEPDQVTWQLFDELYAMTAPNFTYHSDRTVVK